MTKRTYNTYILDVQVYAIMLESLGVQGYIIEEFLNEVDENVFNSHQDYLNVLVDGLLTIAIKYEVYEVCVFLQNLKNKINGRTSNN